MKAFSAHLKFTWEGIDMDVVVKEDGQRQLYPSLTNSKIMVSYGTGNITELVKAVVLHDIENGYGARDVKNSQKY